MICPHCDQAAEFHSHRPHTPLSLVGPVRYPRAYYLCRRCGQGLFPFDRQAGLTARNLTPALERVATQGLRITIAILGHMGSFVSRANPYFCPIVLRLFDSVVTNTANFY